MVPRHKQDSRVRTIAMHVGHTSTRVDVRRSREMLRFVRGYQQAHGGVSPSLQNIADVMGLKSRASAHRMMVECEERGWARRSAGHPRVISVLIDIPVPTAPDGAPLYFIPVQDLPLSHGARNA